VCVVTSRTCFISTFWNVLLYFLKVGSRPLRPQMLPHNNYLTRSLLCPLVMTCAHNSRNSLIAAYKYEGLHYIRLMLYFTMLTNKVNRNFQYISHQSSSHHIIQRYVLRLHNYSSYPHLRFRWLRYGNYYLSQWILHDTMLLFSLHFQSTWICFAQDRHHLMVLKNAEIKFRVQWKPWISHLA
jgi:hypothetical protein